MLGDSYSAMCHFWNIQFEFHSEPKVEFVPTNDTSPLKY